MSIVRRFAAPGLAGPFLLLLGGAALAQPRPYIGYAYPAGAQRGTTVHVRLGGQQLDEVGRAIVSGTGVEAKVLEYHRHLNPQEVQLLRQQLESMGIRPPDGPRVRAPKRPVAAKGKGRARPKAKSAAAAAIAGEADPEGATPGPALSAETRRLVERVRARLEAHVPQPASNAIADLVEIEVAVAADAELGPREIRLVTRKGVSNPLVFDIGQVPEVRRPAMDSAPIQVLGKEEQSLRSRPEDEVEERVTLPCTLNGQVASGEVNRYRFAARKGQRLVFTTAARRLIPFLADAVPGWFQPTLTLYDGRGHEVAYDDDYRFMPDPVILFEVPKDGEYVLAIADAIYRGREDFLYRITAGELPFVTGIFPLGAAAGRPAKVGMTGWNLDGATLETPPADAAPGVVSLTARAPAFASNPVPFAIDTLPEAFEDEAEGGPSRGPQALAPPVIVNGRIDRPGDRDVFAFRGRAGEAVVAEVLARRLDSPLDSVLTLKDASGKILARNDDREDPGAGTNTHHADSYIMIDLPEDGTYRIELEDAARAGGEAFGYRLRVGPPRPDFALRVVPSSLALRAEGEASLEVHAIRRDGFIGRIEVRLAGSPAGFVAEPATLAAGQARGRLGVRTTLEATPGPVPLAVEGVARIDGREVIRRAVPAEDRMQAFLWRHLVPASDLPALVFDPEAAPKPRRPAPAIALTFAPEAEPSPAAATTAAGTRKAKAAPKFTERQIAGRLRQLKILYEEDLLTDDFYRKQVAECQVAK
ncbi:putative subtilase-type serine protease precursor [Aquisphaera giovannonii]|uniref:Putative subtilase-type serine protease n=1 Tax=Aquisphaera giovannonii TaxID=406548 RepID=A0A5B9VWC3_9BACT|nr:PPC domain-containing protein [Aquisphaera giovannonii]QEH32364.1 putative subtilase-type serine protease precursor [Aquisphaera giovannonii]